MMAEDKVVTTIMDVVAEVLEYDIEEFDIDSKLVVDLGADSLDIVDLSFSLGKAFDIKMPQKTVIAIAEEVLGDLSPLVNGNKLTALGAYLLRVGPNAYSNSDAFAGQSLVTVFAQTTIGHWANLCQYIITSGLSGDAAIEQCVRNALVDGPESVADTALSQAAC